MSSEYVKSPLSAAKTPPKTFLEDNLVRAVQHVKDTGVSQSLAAEKFDVPQYQISRRLRGMKSTEVAHAEQLNLPDDMANRLIDWILKQKQTGYAPTHDHVRAIVKQLLVKSGVPEDKAVVGCKWVTRFLKRERLYSHQTRHYTRVCTAQLLYG